MVRGIVAEVKVLLHITPVLIHVFSVDVHDQAVSISVKESAVIPIHGLHDIIVKAIHVELTEVKNCNPHSYGSVELDVLLLLDAHKG